jgi:uncharacterized FlaG/YvyC family protein
MAEPKIDYVKRYNGVIIAVIETAPNGDKVVRDFPSQSILGYYRKANNITTDFHGHLLYLGDHADMLIKNK